MEGLRILTPTRELYTIDANGNPLTLMLLDLMLQGMNRGEDVLIKNCEGASLLTLGMHLMAEYERSRDRR